MKKALLLLFSHTVVLVVGFAIGIYTLPILIAPPAPETEAVVAQAGEARYQGQFRRDLKGSDPLHWGEGTVSVGPESIGLMGRLAPGPDTIHHHSPDKWSDRRSDPVEQQKPSRGAEQPPWRKVVVRGGETQRVDRDAEPAEERSRRK